MVGWPPLYRFAKGFLPADWWRYCRGVYPTFDAARAAIPRRRRIGYDHDDAAKLVTIDRIKPSDYAALFWLDRLFPDAHSVFDFGGNLGWSYHNFQKYLQYPPNLQWLVCDLPAVVAAGREMARHRAAPQLAFTTDFTDGDGFDILHTSGTLQYLEQDFCAMFRQFEHKPRHVIINRVPLTDKPAYYTVQDIGPVCLPYRIHNQADFIDDMKNLGYKLVDFWRCFESSCSILFHKPLRVSQYTGCYFKYETVSP